MGDGLPDSQMGLEDDSENEGLDDDADDDDTAADADDDTAADADDDTAADADDSIDGDNDDADAGDNDAADNASPNEDRWAKDDAGMDDDISLTTWGTSKEERHLTVSDGLLGQIVVDDKAVHAVVTEVLANSTAGVRGQEPH